jgi:exonuclease III
VVYSELDMPDYNLYRCDRGLTGRVGVAVLVRSTIPSFEIKMLNTKMSLCEYESLWVKISCKSSINAYICAVYRPPSSSSAVLADLCTACYEIANRSNSMIIVAGDMNAHHGQWLASCDLNGLPKTDQSGIEAHDCCASLGLTHLDC